MTEPPAPEEVRNPSRSAVYGLGTVVSVGAILLWVVVLTEGTGGRHGTYVRALFGLVLVGFAFTASRRALSPDSRAEIATRLALTTGVLVGAVLLWAAVVSGVNGPQPRTQLAVLVLGLVLAVYAVEEIRRAVETDARSTAVVMVGVAAALVAATWYFYRNALDLLGRGDVSTVGGVSAALVVLVVCYVVWREIGPVPVLALAVTVAYALLGGWFPELLGHGGIGIERVFLILAAGLDGVYGFLTQQAALIIAAPVLYVSLVYAYGGFRVIRTAAVRASRSRRAGYVVTTTLSAAAIGSVSGAYLANADLTGGHTVSNLRDRGVPARIAAGVEAAASTAGQVLPVPVVLAAGGFLLGERPPHREVVLAGLVPAAVLVACLLVGVLLVTRTSATPESTGATSKFTTPNEGVPRTLSRAGAVGETIRLGAPLLLFGYLVADQRPLSFAFAAAVVALLTLGIATPVFEAVYRSATGESWFRDGREPTAETQRDRAAGTTVEGVGARLERAATIAARFRPTAALSRALEETVSGLRTGALVLAPLIAVLAVLNGVIDLLQAVNVFATAADSLDALGQGGPFAIVALALAASLVLAAGLPTVGAVVVGGLFTSVLVASYGADPLTVFYVALYAALAAGVAPPVAAAAVRTARIADANTWAVSKVATGLLAPLFVLPFAFVAHPELVSTTLDLATLRAGSLALLGGFGMVYALCASFDGVARYESLRRLVLVAAGAVAIAHPTVAIQVAAGVVVLGVSGPIVREAG
ncbi:TRAP transporter large permease subunit [Natrononativus amylolyticus]|uniref:TRAP transporter large permease subunit n=1 Tax=Natrononativus amylolyticus TaxID=2963434 RepID=UPI0020CFC954|nr:TRAP transporter large permease subunit [Natrononativus amylolyticus]